MDDLTRQYDYQKLIEDEKKHYSAVNVTGDLKEGGIHAHSSWHYYWNRVGLRLQQTEYSNLAAHLNRVAATLDRPVHILSLGSGYCGNEIELAKNINVAYSITCTDINDELFTRASQIAAEQQLHLTFEVQDLNFIKIQRERYDLIFAHAVLHHVINLEYLFDQIVSGLAPDGLLHLVEVVGMNRKLIWDENEDFANAMLAFIPDQITRNIRLKIPMETDGMEGIRQEDILPLLNKTFRVEFEWKHGAFMRYICTHPELGRYLDPSDKSARPYLDFLIDCDESSVFRGVLRPLEIWGVYRPR